MKDHFTHLNFAKDSNAVLCPDSSQSRPHEAALELSSDFTSSCCQCDLIFD